jgi:excisionase family DNA binding protein
LEAQVSSTTIQQHFLSPAEAEQRLGVSTSTVRRWANRGELEALGLGRGDLARIRIKESALDDVVRPAAPEAV